MTAFRETFFEVNRSVLKMLGALIVLSSLCQMALFIAELSHKVEVATTHSGLRVCTLYNAADDHRDEGTHLHRTFPIVFGVTDTLINFVTIGLFIRTMVAVGRKSRDPIAFVIIRKLTVLGIIDVLFSMVLYTFAMPFYPNMVMLVPLDAIIDSLCIFLVSQFAHTFYNVLCFPCDKVAVYTMDHLELSSTTSGGGHRGSKHSSDQSSGKSLRGSSGKTLSVGNSTKSQQTQLSALSSVHDLDESSGFLSDSVPMDTLTTANGHLTLVPNISDAPSKDVCDEKYAQRSEDVDSGDERATAEDCNSERQWNPFSLVSKMVSLSGAMRHKKQGQDETEERTRAVMEMMFDTDAKQLGSGESNAVTGGTPPPAIMCKDRLKVPECLKSQSAIGLKEYHSHKAKCKRLAGVKERELWPGTEVTAFVECDDSDYDLMSPLTGAKRTDEMICAPAASTMLSKKTRSAGILETRRVHATDGFRVALDSDFRQPKHRRALSEE